MYDLQIWKNIKVCFVVRYTEITLLLLSSQMPSESWFSINRSHTNPVTKKHSIFTTAWKCPSSCFCFLGDSTTQSMVRRELQSSVFILNWFVTRLFPEKLAGAYHYKHQHYSIIIIYFMSKFRKICLIFSAWGHAGDRLLLAHSPVHQKTDHHSEKESVIQPHNDAMILYPYKGETKLYKDTV